MKTIIHLPTDTISFVIKELHTKLYNSNPAVFPENSRDVDFVLKVRGLNEFLIPEKSDGGEYVLSDFDYVRRCVHENLPIDLVLYDRNKLHERLWKADQIGLMGHLNTFIGSEVKALSDKTRYLSQRDLKTPMCVEITQLDNFKYTKATDKMNFSVNFKCFITGSLYYGVNLLAKEEVSPIFEIENGRIKFNSPLVLTFNILISSIPRETKIVLSVYYTDLSATGVPPELSKRQECLATINSKLIDYNGFFIRTKFRCGMWERVEPNPINMCCENTSNEACSIQFKLIEFNKPVIMDTFTATDDEMKTQMASEIKLKAEDVIIYKKAVEADPMAELTTEEIRMLWTYRAMVMKTKPRALSRVVRAVDFSDQEEVLELHRLLQKWPLIEPSHALELLDFHYPDEEVRIYALKCIDAMKDYELVDFLPQLIQALKFELHHLSTLADFLLRRALRNKNVIGHQFFWFLKAEVHDPRVTERYGTLLEAFLNGIEGYRSELYNEVHLQNQLVTLANQVKAISTKEDQKAHLKSSLNKYNYPNEMSLPLDSRLRVKRTVPNTGNVFSSKKKPLMLVWENLDPLGKNILVIQKVGDDLRQDVLTLQMLRLMNNIWKSAGLDLRMLPYQCMATGNEMGMLELVEDSETYGAIIAKEEGTFRVFKDDVLTKWMKEQCNRPESKVTFDQAVENFVYSCAGYCVATYILGIGDRHSDNVMIRRDGRFFHIDFGHFLGNFKSKFGVKRERTPFKFTPHFAHVMGGKGSKMFKKFEELCISAFTCIRKQGSLFIYLFRLMLATGIPELQKEKDIEYMRDTFMFDKKEDEAGEEFRQLIYKCLDAKSQTFNDLVHDYVHYK
ncbi:phosphatidylinositol 3-kinase, putative [Entamoeba invadens IP1]|uniref:phosphatidylinositol 3-kinase n=1 Tax=Entamoeba invadens IP1 TaxID=370355 RepID=A0A0A1TX84_ENTIV|nr:phosphatidylinositol 3-kinase, putative [Entamoeba invadens IP1]ELP85883.1 phosphatidylinositol 3-kinase, putative [Entamoeba invadens IP1]|eukprot:XP_004185229.1 phosphatidylinositol 3-kinase, putative [Entamoeba invadens IP1]